MTEIQRKVAEEILVTTNQAAEMIGLNTSNVLQMARVGTLPFARVGGTGAYVFSIEDVRRIVEKRTSNKK